ncbi:MAG TPA: EscU/YscU/HrcU family type III secretion system export apparatus switch protein [Methylomirabilota bacterium]|nr:EscU/YscU/HrcU family type III secretion system export apparatus switch protein [Methylomirabilota bacterium]
MSESAGEKSELPSQKRLEEAANKGQIARSAEVQTLFVVGAGLLALKMAGPALYAELVPAMRQCFSHLHDIQITADQLPEHASKALGFFAGAIAPLALATTGAALAAGGLQTRFRFASEALELDWNKLNPISGFERVWSKKALVTALFSVIKLTIVGVVSWKTFKSIAHDPIFFTAIGPAEIATFLAQTALKLGNLLMVCMLVFAGADYFYQFWHTFKNLMMTKQEVKEEFKNMEGDPQMKARMRRRRKPKTQAQMLAEVPEADVLLTNPTHLAIALKYDRKTMRAPKVIAKGARLNALKMRELAARHQIPIIENKPLARLMLKHAKVGGEIPAEFYAAVAEILAHVYRVNRYRYFAQDNQLYGKSENDARVSVLAK